MADIDIAALTEQFGTFESAPQHEHDARNRDLVAALRKAAFMLAERGLFTEHELRKKLALVASKVSAKTNDPLPDADVTAAIEQVVASCNDSLLIDDRRYADAWVRSRIDRGQGRERVLRDLTKRGVERAIILDAWEELAPENVVAASAVDAALRKFGRRELDLSQQKERARVARFLQSRGFSWSQIHSATDALQAHFAEAAVEAADER